MARQRVLGGAILKAVAATVLGAVAFTTVPPWLPDAGGVAFARGGGGGVSGNAGGQGGASAGAPGRNGVAATEAPGLGHAAAQDRAALSSALGALNAAHADPRAREGAAPNSWVGRIADHEQAMLTALTCPEGALRDQAIARARAQELEAAANRPVTSAVLRRVDSLLGLPAADPTLGVGR